MRTEKNQLTTNEYEIRIQLKVKYSEDDVGSFNDKSCLEVMLRNIEIRKNYYMTKNEVTRIIDVDK